MSNTITSLEFAVLQAIDNSEYCEALDGSIWTFSVWDNIDRKIVKNRTSLSGAISSLTKKRLAYVAGTGNESEIGLTDAGVAAYRAALTARGETSKKKTNAEWQAV